LSIGDVIDATITDRKLDKLADGEVDFDGEEYDYEETLELGGEIASNEKDDGANTRLKLNEGDIVYKVKFASDLDTSDIEEDETLEFDFLGETVEVSEWDGDSITFTHGVRQTLGEGDSLEILGKTVLIDTIGRDAILVYVGDDSEILEKGRTKDINGIEISVVRILDSDEIGNDKVVIEVGEDVLVEVDDGDEYTKDSIWEYVITENSIGLTLVEEFTSVDEDDDYQALGAGDSISLPNDYITITYDGLIEEDVEDYKFKLRTKSGNEYVQAKGEFVDDGDNDYDLIYIDENGIYDEDLELIDVNTITLGDTDLNLEIEESNIVIDDIELALTLDEIEVDGDDISNKDEDYITNYGVVINNPEDSVDDETFKLSIPEEALNHSGLIATYFLF
jgi:hypothetical protein